MRKNLLKIRCNNDNPFSIKPNSEEVLTPLNARIRRKGVNFDNSLSIDNTNHAKIGLQTQCNSIYYIKTILSIGSGEVRMKEISRSQIGYKIGLNTLIVNVVLTGIKVVIGIVAKSQGMIADGIHSLSDVISTIVVMLGLHFAGAPEDKEHPYGHEKIEPIVAKILAIILFVTALGIGYSGIRTMMKGEYGVPGKLAIFGAALSIIVKEWMYQYTKKGAKQIESSALMADAWHHRSDAFSSVGSLIGVIGARLGIPILDPAVALIICVLIAKVSIDIYKQSIHQLIDHAAAPEVVEKLRTEIVSIEGVLGIDVLKTRVHANKLYVDVDIQVEGSLSVAEGHAIAQEVHDHIEQSEKTVKHCMVHVNPN